MDPTSEAIQGQKSKKYDFAHFDGRTIIQHVNCGFKGHLSFVGYGGHRGHWGQRAAEGKQISGGVYGRVISEAKYESFSILGLLHVSMQNKTEKASSL